MLALKFFVFVGIVGYGIDCVKKLKEDNSAKTRASLLIAAVLFLLGVYMLIDGLM